MTENIDSSQVDIEKGKKVESEMLHFIQKDIEKIENARNLALEEYRTHEKPGESLLRILIDGLIAKIQSEQLFKTVNQTDEKITYKMGLSASFIRTHYIINELYMEGSIIEAMTLIRKQFESLTRLREIDKYPLLRLKKKTPNVCNVFNPTGKMIYPLLSEVAHYGSQSVSDYLTLFESGDRNGYSLLPTFNEGALVCFELNTFMAIHFLHDLIETSISMYDDFEGQYEIGVLKAIFNLALELEVIRDPNLVDR